MQRFTCLLCAFVSGCSGEVLDVPGGDGSNIPSGETVTYSGYVSSSQARPYDTLRITFTSLDAGKVSGSVVPGEGTLPPYDFSQFYPPEEPGFERAAQIVAGFEYQLMDAKLEGKRVTFYLDYGEPYGPWCQAQESFKQPEGSSVEYACIPWVGSGLDCRAQDYGACVASNGTDDYTVPFPVFSVCSGRGCACTADGCTAAPRGRHGFDLRLEGEELNGTDIFLTRE